MMTPVSPSLITICTHIPNFSVWSIARLILWRAAAPAFTVSEPVSREACSADAVLWPFALGCLQGHVLSVHWRISNRKWAGSKPWSQELEPEQALHACLPYSFPPPIQQALLGTSTWAHNQKGSSHLCPCGISRWIVKKGMSGLFESARVFANLAELEVNSFWRKSMVKFEI